MTLLNYKENHFKDKVPTSIDKTRYFSMVKMMQFLGTRKGYHLRVESYLEGMCEHHVLFKVVDGTGVYLATLVDNFGKDFCYYEPR